MASPTDPISFRLDPAARELWDLYAAVRGETLSDMIRNVVCGHIEADTGTETFRTAAQAYFRAEDARMIAARRRLLGD
jgi:hypothetical protein